MGGGPRTQFYFTAGEGRLWPGGLARDVRLHTGSTIVVQGRLRGVLGGRILEVSEIKNGQLRDVSLPVGRTVISWEAPADEYERWQWDVFVSHFSWASSQASRGEAAALLTAMATAVATA